MQAGYHNRTSIVSPRPPAPPYKPPSTTSPLRCWELAAASKKSRSGPKGTICSNSALTYLCCDSDEISDNNFERRALAVHKGGRAVAQRRDNDRAPVLHDQQGRGRRRSHRDGTLQEAQIALCQNLRQGTARHEHVRQGLGNHPQNHRRQRRTRLPRPHQQTQKQAS